MYFFPIFRVFLCNAKRHLDPRSLIRHSQLSVLLCQHISLGNLRSTQMERRQWSDQRKNRIGHSQRDSSTSTRSISSWNIFFKTSFWFQVTTDTDKHFFTSFAARDKTYMMLFKLWQNALLEQVIHFVSVP